MSLKISFEDAWDMTRPPGAPSASQMVRAHGAVDHPLANEAYVPQPIAAAMALGFAAHLETLETASMNARGFGYYMCTAEGLLEDLIAGREAIDAMITIMTKVAPQTSADE